MSLDMWSVFVAVVVGLYGVAVCYLVVYGLHMYVLTALFARRRAAVRRDQQARIAWYSEDRPDSAWPRVTSQIPLYNEANVARRVIEAVAGMDYPAGRHEIQVLDDSTDETRSIVDDVAAELRRAGHDVSVVRRPNREAYKAGALAYGLARARGEVIVVFDADFVPCRDFLRRGVPLLMDEPKNACLQGRWAHLNENHSWLTRAQSLGIDGHFAVEQGGRCWNGLFINFNGTAGLWRREALEDPAVGGWSADTLTEDLDLSYRAQLVGWKLEYCMDLACPSELPESVPALKSQQYRWAKGSMQCARKLLGRIWRSPISLPRKLEATMHLTSYSTSIWMLVVGVLSLPISWINPYAALGGWGLVIACLIWTSFTGPPVAHAFSRCVIRGNWSGLRSSPMLMVLGVGLCLNTSLACISGLFRQGGEFVRTPKSGDTAREKAKRYRLRSTPIWLLELIASAYCALSFCYFMLVSQAVVGGFLAIFAIGFGVVGWQSRPREPRARRAAVRSPAEVGRVVAAPIPSLTDE